MCPQSHKCNKSQQSKKKETFQRLLGHMCNYKSDFLSHLSLCLAAASSLSSSGIFMCLSDPEPLVVRSTVSSCIRMGMPSAENSRSNSTPVAPFLLAWRRTTAHCDGRESVWVVYGHNPVHIHYSPVQLLPFHDLDLH